MKYSSTDNPSRKFDLIGREIMSPRGLATTPRIPAIWRICIMFPRAPESTIMLTGLRSSSRSAATIESCTSCVASSQVSISFWRRSPSEMIPRRNSRSVVWACRSRRSRIFGLSAGTLMSSREIVRPDCVAKRKHRSFRSSRLRATIALG